MGLSVVQIYCEEMLDDLVIVVSRALPAMLDWVPDIFSLAEAPTGSCISFLTRCLKVELVVLSVTTRVSWSEPECNSTMWSKSHFVGSNSKPWWGECHQLEVDLEDSATWPIFTCFHLCQKWLRILVVKTHWKQVSLALLICIWGSGTASNEDLNKKFPSVRGCTSSEEISL